MMLKNNLLKLTISLDFVHLMRGHLILRGPKPFKMSWKNFGTIFLRTMGYGVEINGSTYCMVSHILGHIVRRIARILFETISKEQQ